MTRRTFSLTASGLALSGPLALAAAPAGRSILELRWLHMRTNTENQMQRTTEFLRAISPALKRSGATQLGFFGSVIADESPFILSLRSFPSMAAMEAANEKMAADKEYIQARDAYNAAPGLGYERMESSLLRSFEGMPQVVPPPTDGSRAPRVFELRMYESNNSFTLGRKIKMFNEGEIGIFKRLEMRPVFYGETLIGARMPNLVYMLSFDNLAAREKLWQAFGADPEWQKLRVQPGFSDAENVSNISNSILRPLPFSDIR
jgi:hypothetical protein